MIRLALQFVAVTLVAMATTTYAADMLFGTPSTSTTTGTSTGRFKSRLSPENYLNSVQQLGAQTNSSLDQQVKDLYPKKGAPAMANQPPAMTPNQPVESTTSISNPPTPSAPATVVQQTTTTTTRPSAPPMTSQPPPQQTDTYTGFGGGNKGTTTAPANTGSSTGLGIKY